MFPCSEFSNIQCKLCSSCRYGEYIAAPCSGSNDTSCARCTTCVDMQYVERECTAGVNTICGSCEQCAFVDPQALRQCSRSPTYLFWKRLNCCANSAGVQVPCDSVDLSNIELAVKSGFIPYNFNQDL